MAPSEVHGALCGLLCSGSPQTEELLRGEVFARQTPLDPVLRSTLTDLVERAREELATPGLALTLLLPPEERSLAERAEAVYDWSRGFVYGLGLARLEVAELEAPAREAFDDLIAVTQLDLDRLEAGDENEEALMEVAEFVRVAAMLIYAESTLGAR